MVLKIDNSFKVAKLIVISKPVENEKETVTREQTHEAVLTVFNEFEQVVFQQTLLSNSITEC